MVRSYPDPSVPRRARLLDVPQTDGLPTLLDHTFAVGASLGFHRRVHDAIDGFDETFDTGADDVEFCVRATHAGYTIGFVPGAVTRYSLQDTPRALVRQRFSYGRGLQRLLAKATRYGWISTTPAQRWRDLARATASLARRWPQGLRHDQRLPYLALLAHAVGEATELTLGSRHRRRAAEDQPAVA